RISVEADTREIPRGVVLGVALSFHGIDRDNLPSKSVARMSCVELVTSSMNPLEAGFRSREVIVEFRSPLVRLAWGLNNDEGAVQFIVGGLDHVARLHTSGGNGR